MAAKKNKKATKSPKKKATMKTPQEAAALQEEKNYNGKTPLKNSQHELFCILITSNSTRRFFNNGTNSYAEAFGFQDRIDEIEVKLITAAKSSPRLSDAEEEEDEEFFGADDDGEDTEKQLKAKKKRLLLTCGVNASRLLRNASILKRSRHLLDSFLNHEMMDREMAKVALQDFDLQSKMRAIEHYNMLRKRLGKDADDGAKPEKVVVEFRWQDPEPVATQPKPMVAKITKK